MTVRAKFFVKALTHLHSASPDVCAEVTLAPVYGDTEDNKTWSKYTPQGEIKMMITNPAAIDQFGLGDEFFIDFTKAET